MDYYYVSPYLAHHGVQGQKWGIRRFQNYGSGGYDRKGGKTGKFQAKINKAKGKIEKNNAKIAKLNNFKNTSRNQRLEIKRTNLEIRRAKLDRRVNKARTKREVYNEDPNWFEARALKKAYKLDTRISRIVRKQNAWKMKVDKLEHKNTKLEAKVDKYVKKLDKLGYGA